MSTQDDVTAIETALDALHDYAPGCDVYLADANAALSRLAARCAKQEAENTRLRAALKDDVLYGARLDPTPTTGVNTGGAINPPYEWWSNYIRKGDEAIKSAARAALSAPAEGDKKPKHCRDSREGLRVWLRTASDEALDAFLDEHGMTEADIAKVKNAALEEAAVHASRYEYDYGENIADAIRSLKSGGGR